MRKALIIGLDYYKHIQRLFGCVNDAHNVNAMLARHADGSVNFGTRLIAGADQGDEVSREEIREAIVDLFHGDSEIALLYFAGHGHIESTGGYLCAGDSQTGHDGIPLAEVLTLANQSAAQNRVVILDSCYGGIAGNHPMYTNVAEVCDGVTILTASTAEQYASEENGSGVFTNLLVDALGGAAANLVGEVTPGGIYAHIDQSLGPWAQRPVFKTNVKRFVSLRKVAAPIPLEDLRQIAEFFPAPGFEFGLSPEYEPHRTLEWKSADPPSIPPPDPAKTAVFEVLQKYNRVGLLVPNGAPHMWHAAMESKSARLTALGEHYRRLAERGLI